MVMTARLRLSRQRSDLNLYGDDALQFNAMDDDGSQVDGEGSGGEETFQELDEADREAGGRLYQHWGRFSWMVRESA